MMSTEERLRAATRAAADTVPPGSAPPLRLPDDPAARPRPGGAARRRRWLRALTPLAAAAAVAAAVIVSLTITSGVPTPTGGAQSPARSPALASVPPYYVALTSSARQPRARGHPGHVRPARSWPRVKPPRPYGTFTFVSGAADDRTFVLAAQRWWNITSGTGGADAQQRDNTTPVVFFRLRFDPATRSAQLTRLHPRGRSAGGHTWPAWRSPRTAAGWPSPSTPRRSRSSRWPPGPRSAGSGPVLPSLRHLGRQRQAHGPAALLDR